MEHATKEHCLTANSEYINKFVKHILWNEIEPFLLKYNMVRSCVRMSTFTFGGGYDLEIPNKYWPYFFGIKDHGKLVAAVNCHLSGPEYFRVRSVTVHPDYRKHGLAYVLLRKVELLAEGIGSEYTWSLPGEKYFHLLFEKFGYEKIGPWVYAEMHTPPNAYARKAING